MSTDKAVFHAEFLDCFVDRSFDASCVCNDTSFLDDILEISEIFNIILYRSAEKNIITHGITVIPFFQCGVNSTAVQCGSQSFFVFRICEDVIIRVKLADRFGNRSSDQAEPDKTYGFHDVCVLSSYYLSISRQNYGSILKDTRKNVKHRYKIGEFDE